MVRLAAERARLFEKPTILGGMIPVDHHSLKLMHKYGAVANIDVVAIHGFPGMWWSDAPNWDWYHHWRGWTDKVLSIAEYAGGRPIWITETGLATWDQQKVSQGLHEEQVHRLEEAARAPAERVYWYSLVDLDPRRPAIEGFHVDEHEYHLGLVSYDGVRKPSWERFRRLLTEA